MTRWLGEGALTVDGHVVKPKYKVFGGERLALNAKRLNQEKRHDAQDIALEVLFEDEDMLVVNKPAGLVVHPGAGNSSGTLVNACCTIARVSTSWRAQASCLVRQRCMASWWWRQVHWPTSGLYAISERLVRRRYVAVCEGVMVAGQDIDQAIGRDPKLRTRQWCVKTVSPPRPRFVCARKCAHSAVDLTLGSGRTHQIRVHEYWSCLVGDATYGCRRTVPRGRAQRPTLLQQFPRQALHAFKLDFRHPLSDETLHFAAPVPADMQDLMDTLVRDRDALN